jgi:hypothetical protein
MLNKSIKLAFPKDKSAADAAKEMHLNAALFSI